MYAADGSDVEEHKQSAEAEAIERPSRMSPFKRGRRGPAESGVEELRIGDPDFDDWEVVRDFEDLETARAWRQHLDLAGIEAVLTSDWPLDRFRRGDIALRVPPGRWSEAEEFLSDLDVD